MSHTHFISQGEQTKTRVSEVITNTAEEILVQANTRKDEIGTDYNYKHVVVWKNAIGFLIVHVLAGYGLFLLFTGPYMKFYSVVWVLFVHMFASEGITVGAHRYYTHKTFKAKPPLRALFLLAQTLSGQNSMYIWCRDHRLHHRFSDTDADPHNARRGFFFSHMGWLMTRKHPFIKKFGKQIDMSDLKADWMVMFQMKYYNILYITLTVLVFIAVPVYCCGETWKNTIFICFFFRYVYQLNGTWLVNSAAHLYGTRPYDAKLQPVESWFVSFITYGEGWHNYHHAFPWDYKTAELSMHFNFSASVIRFFEFIGLAWDLKSASPEMVEKRIFRTGDGTHYLFGNDEAKAAVTAIGPVHPFNPTYTVIEAPVADFKAESHYH